MFAYVKPYLKELSIILILMISFSISTALGPVIIQTTIDRFSSEESLLFGNDFIDSIFLSLSQSLQNSFNVSLIWAEVIILGISYLLLQCLIFYLSYKRIIMVTEVGMKAELTIRLELFSHLQELDMSYHDKNEVGRIMSRLTGDVNAIREMIGGQVVNNFKLIS